MIEDRVLDRLFEGRERPLEGLRRVEVLGLKWPPDEPDPVAWPPLGTIVVKPMEGRDFVADVVQAARDVLADVRVDFVRFDARWRNPPREAPGWNARAIAFSTTELLSFR